MLASAAAREMLAMFGSCASSATLSPLSALLPLLCVLALAASEGRPAGMIGAGGGTATSSARLIVLSGVAVALCLRRLPWPPDVR